MLTHFHYLTYLKGEIIKSFNFVFDNGVHYIGVDLLKEKMAKKIKIAILDTGVSKHSDLNIEESISFVDYTSSANDDNGHGTHVAGIINAQDNKLGVIGVAPEAKLYVGKVLNASGSGQYSDIIEGIEWAIDKKVDLINLSFGGAEDSQALHSTIQKAEKLGIVVVAAAGNEGNGLDTSLFPARYDEVISIGAIKENHTRASYSSTSETLDLMAPGSNIISTMNDGSYGVMSGTSMAAPYATGSLALLMSSQKKMSKSEALARIYNSATILGEVHESGHGIINIAKTLGYINGPIEPVNNTPNDPTPEEVVNRKIEVMESFNINKVTSQISAFNEKLKLLENIAIENKKDEIAKEIQDIRYKLSLKYNMLIELPINLNQLDKNLSSKSEQPVEVKQYYATKAIEIRGVEEEYSKVIAKIQKNLGLVNENTISQLDSWEPNNNKESATVIPVGLSLNGDIANNNDADFYVYTANQTGSAFANLYMPSDLNYNLYIFDSNLDVLGNGSLPAGEMETFTFNVVQGRQYYFCVYGASGADYSSDRTYNLLTSHITPISNPIPQIEYGSLTLNTPQDVSLGAGVSKVYSFNPNATGAYKIETTGYGGSNTTNDTYLEVYSDAALTNRIYYNDDHDGSIFSLIDANLTSGITYYIKLRHYNAASGQVSARIKITSTAPAIPTLSVNSPVDVSLGAGEYKVYSISPTTSESYLITTSPYAATGPANDTYLELYSDAGLQNKIAYDDDSNGNTFSKITYNMSAGSTYYIKLRHYISTSSVSCRLTLTTVATNQQPQLNLNTPEDVMISENNSRTFRFIPQVSTTYSFETSPYNGNGPTSDTLLELYSDSACTQLISADDDSGESTFSFISLSMNAGQSYYIKLRGYNNVAVYARLMATIYNPDFDGDGLSNDIERTGIKIGYKGMFLTTVYTNPNLKDSDGDGLDDGVEVLKLQYQALDSSTNTLYYNVIDNPASEIQASFVEVEGLNPVYDTLIPGEYQTKNEYMSSIISIDDRREAFEEYLKHIESYMPESGFSPSELDSIDNYRMDVSNQIATYANVSEGIANTLVSMFGQDTDVKTFLANQTTFVAFNELNDTTIAGILPWWLIFGTRVHTTIKKDFQNQYTLELTDRSQKKLTDNDGKIYYPDLVQEDSKTPSYALMYEIKPSTYSRNVNNYLYGKASAQLEKYLTVYKNELNRPAYKGSAYPVVAKVLEVDGMEGRFVVAFSVPGETGLVYYKEISKQRVTDPQYTPQVNFVSDSDGNRYEVLAQDPATGLSIAKCISGVAAGAVLIILIADDGTGIGTLDDGLIPVVLEFLRKAFSTNIAF